MVAGELATRTDARILLIEAGSPAPPVPRRPAEYLSSFDGDLDWALKTTKQTALAGRALQWPRGRGVGGSSLINAMIWCPPSDADLQTLVDHAGTTWNIESLRADLRGVEALVQPETPRWLSEAGRRFLQAAGSLAKTLEGEPCVYRRANRLGRRRTAGDLLQEAIRRRSQAGRDAAIQIISATVESIVWDGDRAAGVRFQRDEAGAPEIATSRHGVVICAGTIHSPAILMRSGIGPAELLDDRSIPLRVACEEVGANLADHLIMPVIWSTPAETRFPTDWSVSDLARWTHGGTGPIASNLAEVGGFFSLTTPINQAVVNGEVSHVQFHVTPTDYLRHPDPAAPAAITIGVTDCAPRSRGRVTLRDPHPHSSPSIEPNYLAEPRDMATLIAAVRFARRFAEESPLAGWCGPERFPGSKRQEDHELGRAVARYAQTLYHPVGTCRLGTDRRAVVTPDFRVRGTESLWVCDASVLPT
ncbi:MAG: GMC family oxidoreductase, partial [Pirellulaceae bacterium]